MAAERSPLRARLHRVELGHRNTTTPPASARTCCWSSAACSKAGPAPRPRSRPASSPPTTSRSQSHPRPFPPTPSAGQPAHPFVSRGGVKLTGALEQYPIDIEDHVCLDVGASTGGFTEVLLANGASMVFRHRCRARAIACLAARPSQNRLHGGDRYPQLRRQAPADAAGHRRHRRQFHFAESRAAGGAVAGRRADASAGTDKAAIRGARESIPSAASSATRRSIGKSATTSPRSCLRSDAPTSRYFPSPITGGDGNIEFFIGARRG